MRALTEKVQREALNGLGQFTVSVEQQLEIELSDVGKIDHNWRGFQAYNYTFKTSDVGRHISVYTDHSNWTCWVFNSKQGETQ